MKPDDAANHSLFRTPLQERKRHALPVLVAMRARVRAGAGLLEALFAVDAKLLHREFARAALVSVIPFGLTLDAINMEADLSLLVVERAVKRCLPVRAASRGGWTVTPKRSA